MTTAFGELLAEVLHKTMKIRTHLKKKYALRILHRLLVPFLIGGSLSAYAEARPNGLFSNGAVLQQKQALPVWGTANEGEKVTVKFQNQTVTTITKNGRWNLRLKPLSAGGPFTMTIAGESVITLTNILVGEVWLCSGQSNMEMPLAATTNASEATAAARDPQLHFFTVPHGMADEPKDEVSGAWTEATPGSAKYFSAVAYYFGRDLHKALNVPVGLIHSSVGGTPVEAWTAYSALEKDPALPQILARQAQTEKNFDPVKAEAQHESAVAKAKAEGADISKVPAAASSPAFSNERPAVLYNAMIAPL
jgi:sialate O-acetylesterase